MKRSTKKMLMAFGIIFIFALSSIAFVFSGFGHLRGGDQQEQLKPLESFVVDGEIDQRLESAYIQGGFTFIKFFFDESADPQLSAFVEQAPASFRTPAGQIQIIVLRISSGDTFARVVNANGQLELRDLTPEKLFDTLCSMLLAPPAECIIGQVGNETSQ